MNEDGVDGHVAALMEGVEYAQTDAEFLGNPERVHVLDPIAY